MEYFYCEEFDTSIVQVAEESMTAVQSEIAELFEQTWGFRAKLDPEFEGAFLSPKIRLDAELSNLKFVAREEIEAGTLLFADLPKFLYPNFFVICPKEYAFKPIDVRAGVVPQSWICISCLKTVGHVIPVWCSHCGLPLCAKCGEKGKHLKTDTICRFANGINPCRRFLDLGGVYADVAITRLIILEWESQTVKYEISRISADVRVQSIFSFLKTSDIGTKLCQRKVLPLSFHAANGNNATVLRAYAIIVAFGYGFHPHTESGVFHPVLGYFQPSCYPNSEICINEGGVIEIRAVKSIKLGEYLNLDFLQHPLLPTVYRQRLFVSRWRIECNCERCADPSELGTFIGSTKCRACSEGFLTPDFETYADEPGASFESQGVICKCLHPSNRRHRCENRCLFKVKKQRDDSARRMIDSISENPSYSPLMKYKELEELREALESTCGFHTNYFMTQLLNGNLSSPAAQFLRKPADLTCKDFQEVFIQNPPCDWNTEMQKRLQSFDRLCILVRKLVPEYSRIHGYMLLYKAELENELSKICRDRGVISEIEWGKNYILNVTPKFIDAWKEIILKNSGADYHAINKIVAEFIRNGRDEVLCDITASLHRESELGEDFLENLENLDQEAEDHHEPIPEAELPETVEERQIDPEGTVAADTSKRSAAEELLKSVAAVVGEKSISSRAKRRLQEIPHTSPPKTNKLKEALIRQQEEERRRRLKEIKKQLRLLPSEGESMESNDSGSEDVSEEFKGGANIHTSKPEQDESMGRPIPVHKSITDGYYYGRRGCNTQILKFGKKRYRHNGVDLPYVCGGRHLIVPDISPELKPISYVIDCATYTKSDPSPNYGSYGPNPKVYGGQNYSVLKYLCGSPPTYSQSPRKKQNNCYYNHFQTFQNYGLTSETQGHFFQPLTRLIHGSTSAEEYPFCMTFSQHQFTQMEDQY